MFVSEPNFLYFGGKIPLMRYLLFTLLSVALFSLFLFSCRKDKAIAPESCTLRTISFAADVQPIISTNCAIDGCHGTNPNAPFTLLNYGQIDTAVRFNNLLRAIKHEGPVPMPRITPLQPQARKLPDSTIRVIECWIAQGALNN